MVPAWLHFLSIAYLACGALCAIMIAVTALLDVPIRMRQKLRARKR